MLVLRYVMIGIAWLFIVFGLSAFFFGLLCTSGFFTELPTYQFPLGDPTGIVVDNQGKIYCALQFYHRIQVYNSNGQFIQNWYVAGFGNFSFRINSPEQKILVEFADGTMLFYSTEGKLLLEPLDAEDMVQSAEFCFDAIGDCYEIRNRLWNPHITKTDGNGVVQNIVSMSWASWLIVGPFIPWLEILLGFVLLGILQILEEKIPGLRPTQAMPIALPIQKVNPKIQDTILIPLSWYFFLEPLAIILGSVIAIIIVLYSQVSGFLQSSFTVVASIIGIHALLHSIFTPRCPVYDCHGEVYKIGEKPLRYRCRTCGAIYTQEVVEF